MKSISIFSGAMLIVGALCVSGCVSDSFHNAVTEVTVDDYEARVFTSSKGDTIQYRLFIPRDYDVDRNYPLVLFHHGGGGSGNDNKGQFEGPCSREWAGPERQAKNPCFIVAPQIPRRESRDRANQPPSSLDYMAPAAFAAKCLEQGSASLRLPQDKENACEILS